MKKFYCSLSLIFLLSLSLLACGGKKEDPKEEKITIKVEPAQPEQKQPVVSADAETQKKAGTDKKPAQGAKKTGPSDLKALTADRLKERLQREKDFLREKGFLIRDIPEVNEIFRGSMAKIEEGNLEIVDKKLNEAHRIIENFKVDKEFVDNKTEWVKRVVQRAKNPETLQTIRRLKAESLMAYKNKNYAKTNEKLTQIVEEVRKSLEKGMGWGYEPKRKKDFGN